MKNKKLTYILSGVFAAVVISVLIWGREDSGSTKTTTTPSTIEEAKEIVEEKIEEVKEVVEEKVEEAKEIIEDVKEIIPVEIPKLPKLEEVLPTIEEVIPEIIPEVVPEVEEDAKQEG